MTIFVAWELFRIIWARCSVIMQNKVLPVGFDSFYLNRGEAELGKLVELLKQRRVAAVLGESGSGKSVFVCKTLREKLEGGGISGLKGNTWRIVITSPGNNPVEKLANDLATAGANSLYHYADAEEISRRDEISKAIRTEINPVGREYQRVLDRSKTSFNLLLIVDGLEDLVRYSEIERDGVKRGDDVYFVSAILAAMSGTEPVYVVLATDSRYLNAFSRYRGLSEALNNNRFYLGLPSGEEVRNGLRGKLAFQEPLRGVVADKLSADYSQLLEHDIFALEKLRFLFRSGAAGMVVGAHVYQPEAFLREFEDKNALSEIIGLYMDEVVMPSLSEEEVGWFSIIVKALTERRADGIWRRPVTTGYLVRLLAPHYGYGEPDSASVVNLVSRINSGGYDLIEVLGDNLYSRNNIVTIKHDALLFNWPTLTEWVKEEASHAEVYRLLVRKADQYFGARFTPDEMNYFLGESPAGHLKPSLVQEWVSMFGGSREADQAPQNKYLSEGAELTGALEWYDVCKPGRAWAARYDDSNFVHKNPESPQFKSVFYDSNPADVAQIDIAIQFLQISKERSEGLIDRLRQETKVAVRQKKIARVMTIVATVAMIISLIFMDEARSDRMDLELLDFLSVLSSNGVLRVLPSQRDRLKREVSRAVSSGHGIENKDDLLLMLIEKKLLQIEPDHPYFEEITETLKNMHYIQGQIYSEAEKKKAQERVLKIYDQVISTSYTDGRWQHPALYYNLSARLEDAEQKLGITSPVFEKANVVGSAIVPNHHNVHEYAYGDANGKVFIRNLSESHKVGVTRSPVLSLAYSRSGEQLYVGTADGVLSVFNNLGSGVEQVPDTLFTDLYRRPIFGIGLYEDSSRFLIMTATEVYFIRRVPGSKRFEKTKFSQKVEQERVTSFDLNEDKKHLVVTGLHSTILYEVNSVGEGSMTEQLLIQHPDITMTDVAIKRSVSDNKFWIALGGEDGRLWVSSDVNALVSRSVVSIGDSAFRLFPMAHESTITALEFNPVLPQLFSASIFGEARLWNLSRLNRIDDHIFLKNSGRAITAAIYNNENELIIHEVIYGKRVLTNVRTVRAELDLLLEKLK